jgi:hypothetical protein
VLHHGCLGVNVVGHAIVVEGNAFRDVGVAVMSSADLSTDNGSLQILHNRIVESGKTWRGPVDQVVGVWVACPGGTHHGLTIEGNAIGPVYGGQSIVAIGAWMIRGNVLSGCYAAPGHPKGNYDRAIWLRETGLSGQPAVSVLSGNVIEAADADAGYSAGIYIEPSEFVVAHLSNNVVRPGAMRPSAPYGAYNDQAGTSTLNGDVFYGWANVGGVEHNRDGSLNGKGLHHGQVSLDA